jgi:metallophosphoesterase superfamily enzyme
MLLQPNSVSQGLRFIMGHTHPSANVSEKSFQIRTPNTWIAKAILA